MSECTKAKPGWVCTRGQHFDGPCAAIPDPVNRPPNSRWCPMCGSNAVMTERRPNGNSSCPDCNHKAPTSTWPNNFATEITAVAATPERCPRCRCYTEYAGERYACGRSLNDPNSTIMLCNHIESLRATIDTLSGFAVASDLGCPTPGCKGDPRYAAPGKGHNETCASYEKLRVTLRTLVAAVKLAGMQHYTDALESAVGEAERVSGGSL